ncbi:STAS domain-containing protein [Ottowia testudinis]|uniref:STAS domain-containing protein n=1 Tax=Ottowia testudinis TaxID=2816950 RepID=A0A975CFL6_9BURK|nr:STAS domain-containing protein [Ottowia testudinis]QTD44886.1 STAS domain-containing protein [Ottowia testudinis]
MSKDPVSSGGLLSKVVKFVKSPTTHWSDLDRPTGDGGDSESRLALKEMIERKRRNDFVRNREFDMLRKARRRESLKGVEGAVGGPSFYPSSQPANTGERARTLKKIDEIEAQMSTAWFKRQGGSAAAPVEGAPAAAPAPAARSHAPTQPQRLAERAQSAPTQPPQAFAPTLPLGDIVRAAPPAPAAQAPAPVSKPVPKPVPKPATNLIGDVPEFNVEVLAAAKQDPEIEEAAIRFANGDAAGAEAVLLDLVAEGGSRREDVYTWLTLFDLYRCMGDPTKFDDAAFGFAALFGRSAPQWALVTDPASAPAPIAAAAPAAVSTGPFHWTCPSTMGTQSMAALKATLDRLAPPWRIDWRHLKAIDPAALPALIEVLKRWGESPAGLKFLSADRLLQVLAERSPTDDRGADPRWWDARLALLRILGEMDEFELVALNYCVTYEVSPPAWEAPKNTYGKLSEDGQTLLPSEFGPEATEDAVSTLPAGDFGQPHAAASAAADSGVVKAKLEGEYLGTAEAALKPLIAAREATAFEINCRKLLRVDFGAAGDLLNWSMEQQTRGHQVTFKQVNRLVAAFFGVIGINDSARVMLRTD